MKTKLILMLAAGLALVPALPPVSAAQTIKRETARAIDSVAGVDVYHAYCAVCHGMDGKGKGPAEAALKTPVPDLTTLAKRSGGKFSGVAVESTILGKGKVAPAHGSPDMPIWGPVFRAVTSSDAVVKLQSANLVQYIETMQQK